MLPMFEMRNTQAGVILYISHPNRLVPMSEQESYVLGVLMSPHVRGSQVSSGHTITVHVQAVARAEWRRRYPADCLTSDPPWTTKNDKGWFACAHERAWAEVTPKPPEIPWWLEGVGPVAVESVSGGTWEDAWGNTYTEPMQTVYKYETVTIRPANSDDEPYARGDSFGIILPNEAMARDTAEWHKL